MHAASKDTQRPVIVAGRLNPMVIGMKTLLVPPDTAPGAWPVCKLTLNFGNNLAPWWAHPFSLPGCASSLKNWDSKRA